MPQSFFFNTDHQLEAVNATPLYPKPLITALADMKIILLFDKILKTFQMNWKLLGWSKSKKTKVDLLGIKN